MKSINILGLVLIITLSSCKSGPKPVEVSRDAPCIRERIDGPAHIRSQPNGQIIYTINDNAMVELGSLEGDWYRVMIFSEFILDSLKGDSLQKGQFLFQDVDTIGTVVRSHATEYQSWHETELAVGMLFGYTHKQNIKPESILENGFQTFLESEQYDFEYWLEYMALYGLEDQDLGYERLNIYGKYESAAEDPSPGFRILLFFEGKEMVGVLHSRALDLPEAKSYTLDWDYTISFFSHYPDKMQQTFVDFMNDWIKGVD